MNTYGEETKQLVYARLMGLQALTVDAKWPAYDLGGRSVLDIGGGPTSLLLKCVNGGRRVVADPADWPGWVGERYAGAGIEYVREPGEKRRRWRFDEVWLYNVLQHVGYPERLVARARAAGKVVRAFDWLDTAVADGHPHTLRQRDMDRWFGGTGAVVDLAESECYGRSWSGVFQGRTR